MDRNFGKEAADGSDGSPPCEAWLFVQAILGKPIPSPYAAKARAQAEREHLEWLAPISPRHADQLHKLESAEAKARHERELLVWLANFSPKHKDQLSELERREAEIQEAQRRWELFAADYGFREAQWDASKHPRLGGPPNAGWWVSTGGAGGSGGGTDHDRSAGQSAPPAMLDLAHTWWQTNNLLEKTRRDLEELPKRIASEKAQLGTGGRYAYVHAQNLAKAEQELAAAQALAPQLEKQQHDLEQQYHDSGFDEIPYSTWTPGETLVGGTGIERVGHAVATGGSPAGLQPTGIEQDVALGAPAILQLGKAVLKRTLANFAGESPALGAAVEPSTTAGIIPGRGGRYGHFEDPPAANSGLDFTPTQKRNILSENARRNDGVLIDDRTGEVLVPGQQRQRGVPAPPNEAQVDHVYPKALGGPNTYSNAEVRSRLNNVRKGKRLE